MGPVKPFCYYGRTELLRFGIGAEFIGGNGKYGLMITVLWWFIIPGLERSNG